MGGNAFENTNRLTEQDYKELCQRISHILSDLNLEFSFPPEVSDKAELVKNFKNCDEPYGDVDIVVKIPDDNQNFNPPTNINITQTLAERLNGEPGGDIKKNGKTYSFLEKEKRHQIDLFFTTDLKFTTAIKGNNDFLAFLGHLLTKFGLKVTEKGFFLTLRVKINPNDDGEGMRRDVFLTNGNISNTAYHYT